MEETHDEFISEAVDILVELLKAKDYEEYETGRLKEIIKQT